MKNSEKVPEIDLEELTECPECDSEHIVRDYKRGEVTCRNCGLVVDDQVIDQGPEWRAFDSPIFHFQHAMETSTLFNVGVSPIVP